MRVPEGPHHGKLPTHSDGSYLWLIFKAVTATATERVREDIIKILRLPPPPQLQMFLLSTSRKPAIPLPGRS
jgi:superfamily II DNA helicase RecQ